MNKTFTLHVAALVSLVAITGCEKEDEITGSGEELLRPIEARIVPDRTTILTGGRDSSHWNIKLFQVTGTGDTTAFQSTFPIEILTDRHGYFLHNGEVTRRISLETDENGETDLHFYGSREPGISETLIWGEGFGPNTVTVAVVVGFPHYLVLEFKDPQGTVWSATDTIVSGERLGKPDSTMVRVTVLDQDQLPLEGVTVDLSNGSPPLGAGTFGYFKSLPLPEGRTSRGLATTDVSGFATDIYYSDALPGTGDPVSLNIVALVDSARFGRIETTKSIALSPP